jgi:hypothetical protein
MLDEIIEIMKRKPEIIENEPKEFKVVYDDIDLPLEEDIKEFNFDLFEGRLMSNNLEQVIVDKFIKKRESREEREERQEQEERQERQEREERKEKPERLQREESDEEQVVKILKKPKGIGIIADIPSVDWKVRGKPIINLLPEKLAKFDIRVSSYFMNNREKFVEFINKIFDRYKKEFKVSEDDITCDSLQNDDIAFSLLNHQKIIRDYLSSTTPYRGLLVYHSLGAGKTASSIATAEGLKDDKKVYILTPASLEKNYREELKKAGDPLYRIHQCWEWVSIADPKKDKSAENKNTIDTLTTV